MPINFKKFKKGDIVQYTWTDASRATGWGKHEPGTIDYKYVPTTVGIFLEITDNHLVVTSDVVKDRDIIGDRQVCPTKMITEIKKIGRIK